MRPTIQISLVLITLMAVAVLGTPRSVQGDDDMAKAELDRLKDRMAALEHVVGALPSDQTVDSFSKRLSRTEREIRELRSRSSERREQPRRQVTSDIRRASQDLERRQADLVRRLDEVRRELRDVSNLSRELSELRRGMSNLERSLRDLSSRVDRLERK